MATLDGYLSQGSYQYIICYEWTDNNGLIQRSTTSEAQTIELPRDGYSVSMYIPTLRVTQKTGTRDEVRIVVYRTEANQQQFYQVTSVTSPLFNNPKVDSVLFKDIAADRDIVSNQLLYTTGGVLDNEPAPACRVMASYNNRIWLGGLADDDHSVWFSKTLQQGSPIEFSSLLSRKVDQLGGAITALARLDTNLIIFKENAIYALAGEGPNDTGAGQDFQNPTLITTDVGCTNPNSVATTPQGVFFQSAKGIMLLDRGFQTMYVGKEVEKFNGTRISATTVVPDQNIIIFNTLESRAPVYDYLVGQWATFTGHDAVDSLMWGDQFVFLKKSGVVYAQNKEKYTDGSSFIKLRGRTSFLVLNQLQGFQRVKRIILLGEFKGNHKLNLQYHYDYNDNFTSQSVVDAAAIFGANKWGSSETWGSDEVWGGTYSPYQFIDALKRTTCQSLSIAFEDSQSSGYNEGYSISAITLEIGVKQGFNKLPLRNKSG